jgi:type I restriction enzyme M protein
MLNSETRRRIDAARDVLVGKLPLPTDQVELITLALVYKFMDDLDEESVALGGKRTFFSAALAPYRWRALTPATLSADERVRLFSEGLESLGHPKRAAHLPELFRDLFRNAFLKFRDGRILTLFLAEIDGFAYSHSEELGNAFEYLLSTMGAQGDNGQFRTPRHLIEFIVACLDPRPGERILDPACGTGGFLVSAYRHILRAHTTPGSALPGDRLSHTQRERLHAAFTGYDITDLMVKLSKVNLFLHHFPSPDIHIYDTLSNDARWAERFDLILANPPFMTPKGGVTPHARFRIPAKKAEVLFTDYIAEHLDVNGRAGIVVPNGIVATTQTAYVRLRRMLVEESLVAVVSLPSGMFKPYSGVKTSVLFLDKGLARRTREVLFLKVSADGFDLGDKRNPIEADDLPLAQRYLTRWFKQELGDEPPQEIPWAQVSRETLLADTNTLLIGDRFTGGDVATPVFETKPLAEIAEIQLGKMLDKEKHRTGTKLPYLRNVNVRWGSIDTGDVSEMFFEDDERDRFGLQAGDVLVCEGGEPGRAAVWDGRVPGMKFQKALHRVRFKIPFEPKLFVEILRVYAQNGELASRFSGTTIKHLTREVFAQLPVPLPPLDEQRRIVSEVEAYQQVIDGARQILAAYRPAFEVSPDWPMHELRELILGKPKNGYSGQPVAHETKLKVLALSATTSGRLDPTKFKYLAEDIPADAPCRCRKGDIYLQRGNTADLVGTAALFDLDAPDFIYPDLMIRVQADESKIQTKFLLHTLQSPPVRTFLKTRAGGSAGNMPKINQGIVEAIPIPLPPLPEQARIVAELDAEAARLEAVRGLIPAFEAKIARTLARVWGAASA